MSVDLESKRKAEQERWVEEARKKLFVPQERFNDAPLIGDRIASKAASIWCRLLRNPKFDNGDKSDRGFMCMLMQEEIAERDGTGGIDEFGSLFARYAQCRAHVSAHIDYGPDTDLRLLAEQAGMKTSRFPIKSGMNVDAHKINVRVGYGAQGDCYYPMPDGRWLVTSLYGTPDDMANIIELAGRFPEKFKIDEEE